VSLVVVVQADLQLTMSYLDSAAVARCLDWAVEAVWAPARMDKLKGHVEDNMLMSGLIGAAAVMVEDVVVVEWAADTRVADVLREGLGAVDVARGGVARVRHVEEGADVTNFALYHSTISVSRTRSS